MKIKGLGDKEPLGMITAGDTCWYFYYLLDDGSLVELEVELDTDAHRYSRKVAGFISQSEHVAQLLAL